MRVLVTGATGFIGGRIFEDLSAAGIDVLGTCRNASPPGPDFAQLDVSDTDAVEHFFSGKEFDAVFHCAGIAHRFGQTPDSVYREVNVEGTRNIARAAREHAVPNFILLSSVLVYGGGGDSSSPKQESDAKIPRDAYAQSKLDAELAAIEAFKGSPASLLILRPAPVVGEGSKGNFAKLVNAIARGRFIWIGTGRNFKSLTYVGDISAACRLFLADDNPAGTRILNIASPPGSMKDIVAAISGELEKRVPGIRIPERFARFSARGGQLVGGSFGNIGRSIETWLSEDVYSTAELAAALPELETTPLTEAVRRDVRARRRK